MKVVSFCHFLQGPVAMQYLADMGADVIKIEPPRGAFERNWAGADRADVGGVSAFFLCANRNVRSLALDLKHPSAKEVVFRLIERSHVVAENFRPETLDRLGFGYEAVRARKPGVIYASASGFGATGPMAARPGQDLLAQAMSGMIAASGDVDDPVPVGAAVADQHGGALLALGIVGAYARWLETGEGTRVETNLFGAAIDLQNESLVTYHASGLGRRGLERDKHLATWMHSAPYGVYRTVDCRVALSLNDIGTVGAALESPAIQALAERNAYIERDALAQTVAAVIAGWSYDDLAHAFDRHGVWYARVDEYDDLFENPQAAHNQVFSEVEINGERARLVNHPLRYDGRVPEVRGFALSPGADTRPILEEAGFSTAEVAELLRDNAVFAPADQG